MSSTDQTTPRRTDPEMSSPGEPSVAEVLDDINARHPPPAPKNRRSIAEVLDEINTRHPQPPQVKGRSIDEVLDEIKARHPQPVQGSGRNPAMSAMTAANRVRAIVETGDRGGAPLTLNDGDIEALNRVDPTEASDAASRPHQRPERAPQQPDPNISSHHR